MREKKENIFRLLVSLGNDAISLSKKVLEKNISISAQLKAKKSNLKKKKHPCIGSRKFKNLGKNPI